MSNGGPWGGGGGNDDDDRDGDRRPGRRPGEGSQIPEIEEIMKKGTEQLRVLMGGRGARRGGNGGGGGSGLPAGPAFTRSTLGLAVLAAAAVWAYASFYTVKPEERSIELMFGRFQTIGQPGLNFAPWPVVRAEIVQVTGERTTDIGTGRGGPLDTGLMLTRDQNIVDIEFQVVWNVMEPDAFLFNLADPEGTIRAVSESAMRDIIARSELAPILNRDRGAIGNDLLSAVQGTLDSYQAGIRVVRMNFDRADPPREVIDSFRQVQAAQQERDRLEKEADAYANTVTARARGDAARLGEEAEGYRAQVVNDALGETSRFIAVYEEYIKAPEVTRKRMYLETMEKVFGGMNKVILDGVSGAAGGVVPYLPLNELNRAGGTN
ncbi:FtsH protease activity modulator HflK [Phaeovulum sp.]|uniref:FtsH protease activity modulator HflK n=1 Tax=Phaeovulum sp. TaxID=2934796 RepID=UPI00273106DB|nr:FtsH protease activity modulator HflK [Phaeovulum sp.]MDP1669403.1 FtsH protease activity modulator HflK [Phaeovulum sp.]MDP2062350.1 FtsH protease activity modulator HflK [Phaeovulum sp.]MDP3861795.1 FtsH protease activity modulator HflK [Phaeovulum sp.]MDZ4119673.1 FtsH protease activity modulator HflK [Phaeovulum sp.]